MAYKRTFKKKRTYRRPYRKPVTNYTRANARPFPDVFKANLRYVEEVPLDATAALMSYHTFCINSLFDPNTTGAGHQPMGFDQLSQLYNRYLVTGAKITATFTGDVSTGESQRIGMTVHEASGFSPTYVDAATLIEQGKTVYSVLGPTDGNRNTITLSKSISMRREFGVSDLRGNIEQYGALVSTSPANGLFVSLWAAGMSSENPVPCDALVKIEFTGYFLEPTLLSSS